MGLSAGHALHFEREMRFGKPPLPKQPPLPKPLARSPDVAAVLRVLQAKPAREATPAARRPPARTGRASAQTANPLERPARGAGGDETGARRGAAAPICDAAIGDAATGGAAVGDAPLASSSPRPRERPWDRPSTAAAAARRPPRARRSTADALELGDALLRSEPRRARRSAADVPKLGDVLLRSEGSLPGAAGRAFAGPPSSSSRARRQSAPGLRAEAAGGDFWFGTRFSLSADATVQPTVRRAPDTAPLAALDCLEQHARTLAKERARADYLTVETANVLGPAGESDRSITDRKFAAYMALVLNDACRDAPRGDDGDEAP
ncbi:hypothetical protein M885DRAFT_545652 [Pelagophyceae sp. CCMP2097]|nr:hypothetical protein M885DRAFT_545652 [Pelagophyceae sp. CCMP2097]